MNAIETISLTKFYGKSRGINDIDLTVAEGDFFGFIGPNGAGKSTTIRILTGLISKTSGTANIFGKEVGKSDVLADIGHMPSEANFYHGMKVREVIKYSAELRERNCAKEAARLCERLELDVNKKISELSLGNRKKVSIVCALQHKPRLCILDEPTSGLDPLMQREFYAILEECNAEGATIFLSSHILSEIQKYCKRAAVIREGRLLVCDRVENLVHTNAKKVTLSGISEPPKLDGIGNVELDGNAVKFLYSGVPSELLNALAPLPITDISITEPDLEEIFMHYYKENENDNS
ncbi:MAG: ABC transporter ATP-binding protein [Oscillospiraceae bacterium]|nr:ABC transporter ATP-binding protein [Oscillospiraceae bacterium]